MSLQFGSTKIGGMQYNGVTIGEAMYNGQVVYKSTHNLPVVHLTGEWDWENQAQFRQLLVDFGTTYQTVQTLPFTLDTSQAKNLRYLFHNCYELTEVPTLDVSGTTTLYGMFHTCRSLTKVGDLQTAHVTSMYAMFNGCAALTDGNVRLIGRNPSVTTTLMISNSGLTRLPFYNAAGNPI